MNSLTWAIAGLATAGVIARPMRWPEWIWAVSGAALLIALGLIPWQAAAHAVGEGWDVYLFLIGMMLLSETARAEGLFDWLAATAVNHARGSTFRLFTLVYLTGTVVTVFLSNDATAVVLTPAVFACALIANAASFVLPISNPANLVLYGGKMPELSAWFASFALPSLASILVTFLALGFMERKRLSGACAESVARKPLGRGGIAAFAAIAITALLLILVSAFDQPLGPPTAFAGIVSLLGVSALARRSPLPLVKEVSWGVLLLVAGLFVLVEALNQTGVIAFVAGLLARPGVDPVTLGAVSGTVLAFGSNLINNLPAGLITSLAVQQAAPPRLVVDSLLIAVDLGPNLSVTGSLATILWLQAIRREGEDVGFWRFLKVGAVAMPTALIAALGTRLLIG